MRTIQFSVRKGGFLYLSPPAVHSLEDAERVYAKLRQLGFSVVPYEYIGDERVEYCMSTEGKLVAADGPGEPAA